MKIKIYGYGWVGKAMKVLFPEASIHDPEQHYNDTGDADIAFVCVPTNLIHKPVVKEGHLVTPRTPEGGGKLDTSIVEDIVKNTNDKLYIIRSTVMPGTCDKLTTLGKKVVMQPEYLGETTNHPMSDQKTRQFVIIGGSPENRRSVIELYQNIYNAAVNIRQVSCLEAEVIKLSENRAIAFKVAQCQELYDVCQAAGIDYYTIREAVYSDDPRFNLWWTFVFPDKRGFQSKCIPKDVYGWAAWAESLGYSPDLTNKLLEVNEKYLCSRS